MLMEMMQKKRKRVMKMPASKSSNLINNYIK